jgi:hypothetical protein
MEVVTQKSRPGWLRVHWKLVVSVWLGLSLAGAVAAFSLMTNSDAAKLSVATAESNAILSEKLGWPMKTGWFISGKIEVNPAGGHAELAIPISGPKSHGTLYSESRKRAGVWKLDLLEFADKQSGEHVNLLASDAQEKKATTPQ